jgi:hypothetical protein
VNELNKKLIIGAVFILALLIVGINFFMSQSRASENPESEEKPAAFVARFIDLGNMMTGVESEFEVKVENIGDLEGSITMQLSIKKENETIEIVESEEVTLSGREAKKITYFYTFENPGEYKISVLNASQRINVFLLIKAEDLIDEWNENQVRAKQKYKDKEIVVYGTIDNIDSDIFGYPYVVLDEELLSGVQCIFDNENEGLVAGLEKGDTVAVFGKCSGKIYSLFLRYINVNVRNLIKINIEDEQAMYLVIR